MLAEITPYLTNKDVTIYLPPKAKVATKLRPYLSSIKNRIKATYHGQLMSVGCIRLSRMLFDIIWQDDEIYDITALTLSKCLTFSHRLNLHSKNTRTELIFGSVLPVSQAVKEIEQHLQKSAWALISNLPPVIISQFTNNLHTKDIKLILPHGAKVTPQLKTVRQKRSLPGLVKTSSRIYGREVQCGGICLPNIHFGISWEEDEMVSVRTLELVECIECAHWAHKFGWHFCKRIW